MKKSMRDSYWKRRGMKETLWLILPLTITAGWLYPPLGFAVLICMAAAVAVSFKYGRAWCDVCPRGAFADVVMKRFSRGRDMPRWLRGNSMRVVMLVMLMGIMISGLLPAESVNAAGLVFVRILTATSILAVVLTLLFDERSWCALCPMGSMAAWIGKGRNPLQVNRSSCRECGLCTRVCPMGLYPASGREEGRFADGDCIKCAGCAVSCPVKALSFNGESEDCRAA
ncbi:MAG: 4Fe-4S binding protein [bacterium]|nr:4Fe-4S binding protein [bacterium]